MLAPCKQLTETHPACCNEQCLSAKSKYTTVALDLSRNNRCILMYLLRTPLRQRSKMLNTYKTHEIILASLGACSELVAALCHGSYTIMLVSELHNIWCSLGQCSRTILLFAVTDQQRYNRTFCKLPSICR